MPTFVGVGGSVYLGIVYMGHREKTMVGLLHLVEGTVCKKSSSPFRNSLSASCVMEDVSRGSRFTARVEIGCAHPAVSEYLSVFDWNVLTPDSNKLLRHL